MNNIRVKQESLSNWREDFDIDEAKEEQGRSDYGKASVRNKRKFGKEGEPAVFDASGERGKMIDKRREEHKKKRGVKKEHVEGGIQVQNVADGLNFTEVETVDIIKPEPIKGASNWKLEMVTEMLISEGYNDDEIATILTEGVDDVGGPLSIGGVLSGIARAGKFAYNLGKGARGVVNRGIRDTKLTKDILDTAKKLRQPKLPQGVEVVKKGTERGGGIAKSFKGFMQNVKDRATKIRNSGKKEIQSTAKDVDVLGGAATNPTAPVKPMKIVSPTPIGDGIAKVGNQVKTGVTAAAVTGGVVAGSKLTGGSPSKVSTATPTPPVEKKVEAPITNDGKKEVNPSKNEKITTKQKKSGGRPFDADRGKTVDRVYGAQIEKTRKLKGDPAAEKQRKKFMSRPVTSLEMEEGAYQGGGTTIKSIYDPVTGRPSGFKQPPIGTPAGKDPIEVLRRMRDLGGAQAKKKEKRTTVAASHELKGDQIDEFLGGVPGDGYIGHPNLDIKNPFAKKQTKKKVMPNAKGGGLLNKTAGKLGDRKMELQKYLDMQSYSWRDELGLTERKLTKKEEKKKEDIVMGMKDDKKGFKKRYGDDAKSVMYATATKIAKEKA